MDLIRGLCIVKTAKAEDGRTHVIASTDDVDRSDDVVDQTSWQLDRHARNPVVLWAHSYRDPPVGTAAMAVEDGALHGRIKWDDNEVNQLGTLVAHQYRTGVLSAVSVGFRPHTMTLRSELPKEHPHFGEKGYLLRDNELYELSAVPVPANPEAHAVRGFGPVPPDAAALREWLQDPAFRALLVEELRPLAAPPPDQRSAFARIFGVPS